MLLGYSQFQTSFTPNKMPAEKDKLLVIDSEGTEGRGGGGGGSGARFAKKISS